MPDEWIATYRVQLGPDFSFGDLQALVPYLSALGVSHVYCSPIWRAAPRSSHGYDVTDPTAINEELGGPGAYLALVETLRRYDMGVLLDIVPNHMAADADHNSRWREMLRAGPGSMAARFFDVDWHAPQEKLRKRVLLPVLPERYGRMLVEGRIAIDASGPEPHVRVDGMTFPLNSGSVASAATDAEALDAVLQQQHYALSFWRSAPREADYRRFFDISGLVGVRQEDPQVFAETHSLVRELVDSQVCDGLRVDHVDGLADPQTYLSALAGLAGPIPVWAEKILANDEEIPASWRIAGTTGYEFASMCTRLQVDAAAEGALTRFYEEFTGERRSFARISHDTRTAVMRQLFAAETIRLSRLFEHASQDDLMLRDFTGSELLETIVEMIAHLDRYRVYLPFAGPADGEACKQLAAAGHGAARCRADLGPDPFNRLREILVAAPATNDARELRTRFQQLSAAAMAKGVEDTALYRYTRLLALNDVGSDPGVFSSHPSEFHSANALRAARHPHSLLAGSTHDSKRSDDVRARLVAISYEPRNWIDAVTRWEARLGRHGFDAGRPMAYYLYQTLAGAWPIAMDRVTEHIIKAAREAKVDTSWLRPDEDYEAGLRQMVQSVYGDPEMVEDIAAVAAALGEHGRRNSLVRTTWRLTAPGVPDLYRGCEEWDFSLTDPDNRRPVDLARLAAALHDDQMTDKHKWTRALLELRRRHRDAYSAGAPYRPLAAKGGGRDLVVAYMRGDTVAVITSSRPNADMTDTCLELPDGTWRDLRGERSHAGGWLDVEDLLVCAPGGAVLTRVA